MSKQAYTATLPGKVLSIRTDCKLSEAYDFHLDRDKEHPAYAACSAQWDTGAVMSVASTELVRKLRLQPYGMAKMLHANGESIVKTYFVNLLLPNKLEVQVLQVMEGNLSDTDFLIGMDVIGLCDFAITHPNGDTVFSFDIPSSHLTDYRD